MKRHGLYFNGLILVSSILNFQTAGFDSETWTFRRGNDLPYVLFLPTYAATAWYHGKVGDAHRGRPLTEFVAEVEGFAAGEYASALLAGSTITDEQRAHVVARLAEYTDWRRRTSISPTCESRSFGSAKSCCAARGGRLASSTVVIPASIAS